MTAIETRIAPTGLRLEIRAGRAMPYISGYASLFNVLSTDLGGYRERISRGAFSRSLREKADVLSLVAHDTGKVLGRISAGTLQLSTDSRGLHARTDPPATGLAKHIVAGIRRGDICGMSFAFIATNDNWDIEGGVLVRTVSDLRLYDVSVCANPAYEETSAVVEDRSAGSAAAAIVKLKETAARLRAQKLRLLQQRQRLGASAFDGRRRVGIQDGLDLVEDRHDRLLRAMKYVDQRQGH
jgi:uncharacterized protein